MKKPQLVAAALVLVLAGVGAAASRAPLGAEHPAPGVLALAGGVAGF